MHQTMNLRSAPALLGARFGARHAPLSIGFELTHRCNLACAYCDRHIPRADEMAIPTVNAVLDDLCAMGMRTISLDGGEPLIHPAVDDVVARLVDRGVHVNMNSNGLLVPRKLGTVRKVSKLKVSLDGPQAIHDAVRGGGSYTRALRGILAAREVGVAVELTCTVGSHNADAIDELVDLGRLLGLRIVFQPERAGLFNEKDHGTVVGVARIRRAFDRIETHKGRSGVVANRWASLRHFRSYPRDTLLPCAAGRINATLDPYGFLYPCGLTPRVGAGVSVLRHGARGAFARLERAGCAQCWCARVVEENYAWGGRLDAFLPSSRGASRARRLRQRLIEPVR